MVPVEVRKIIVESRAKGIPAEEIRKVTGVSLSAINNIVIITKKEEPWKEIIREGSRKLQKNREKQ